WIWPRSRRRRGLACGRRAAPACSASPPATTAASWGRSICTCTSCWRRRGHAMLRLRYRASTTVPVEAGCVVPDQLAGKSVDEIARLPVHHGNRQEPLGEFFAVAGDSADLQVVVEGDCSRVKWIGAGMSAGRLTVEGNAGMHVGSEMRGGE